MASEVSNRRGVAALIRPAGILNGEYTMAKQTAYKKSACSVDPKSYEVEGDTLVTSDLEKIVAIINKRLIDILHLAKLLIDNKGFLGQSSKDQILDKLYIARELLNRLIIDYDD